MSLLPFFLVCLSLYALLAFVASPWLEQRLRLERTLLSVHTTAWLALVGVLRGLCLIGALTSGFLAVTVFLLLHLRPGTTPAEIGQAVVRLQSWHDRLVGFGPYWGGFLTVVLVAGLAVFAYRSGKRRLEKAFSAVFDREFQRVVKELEAGRLEPLPETPEMTRLAAMIAEAEAKVRAVMVNSRMPAEVSNQALQELFQQIAQMRHGYILLDIRRRMDMRLDPDAAKLPEPGNWWEQLQTLLISRGLLSCLSGSSRLLYVTSLLLLVPCLMGLYSPHVGARIEAQVVEFGNIKLDLSQAQALAEWHLAEQAVLREEQQTEDEQAAEQNAAEQQAVSQRQQQDVRQLQLVHATEIKIDAEQAGTQGTEAPTPAGPPGGGSPRSGRDGAKPGEGEGRTGPAREKRQAEEMQAMADRHTREMEELRQRQAEHGQERRQRYKAQKADLNSRQQAEGGRDVRSKEASRGNSSPEQWRQTAADEGRQKTRAQTEQVKHQLQRETEGAAARLADQADERIADLYRGVTKQRLQEAKVRMGPPASELTAADRDVLREVAGYFERASAEGIQDLVPERLTGYDLRSQATRGQILRRAAKYAPAGPEAGGLQLQPALSRTPDLPPEQRFVLQAAEQAADPTVELLQVGRQAYTQLEEAARRKPSLIQALRDKLRAFQEPLTRRSLANRLAINVLGTLLSGPSPDLQVLFQGLVPEVNHVLKRTVEVRMDEAMLELLTRGDLGDSLNRMARASSDRPVVPPKEQSRLKESVRTVFSRMPEEPALADTVRHYPPSVSDIPEPHVKQRQAADSVAELSKRLSPQRPAQVAEQLSDSVNRYDDLFPGQLGAETRTERGRMLGGLSSPDFNPPRPPDTPSVGGGAGIIGGGNPRSGPAGRSGFHSGAGAEGGFSAMSPRGGGGVIFGGGNFQGGRGGSGAPMASTPRPTPSAGPTKVASGLARTNFLRARSFGALRGFARVGGVLIGQEPTEPSSPLNCLDLRWEADGPNLRLLLIDKDGQVRRSRPFRKSLVYHALTYAADGRPLAVTMATAQPLSELRILLHPTLVDTPLGYRIVELDRFVDRFSGNEKAFPGRRKAELEVRAQADLYRLARAQRLLALRDLLKSLSAYRILAKLQAEASQCLESPQLRKSAALALQEPQLFQDEQRSPLPVKKEFFDPALVQLIVATAKAGDGLDQFLERLKKEALQDFAQRWNRDRPLEQQLQRLLTPAPEFQIWSGVREQPYSIRPEILLPDEPGSLTLPFQFMLQVAFTSPPLFLDEEQREQQIESYIDKNPWEFPALREALQKRVLDALAGDAKARDILADTAEFTVLQRLFRAAFLGKLGKDFPIERLLALTEATVPASGTVRSVRTPRWNSGGGLRALAAENVRIREVAGLIQKLDKLPEHQRGAKVDQGLEMLRACRDLLEERSKQAGQLLKGLQPLLEAKPGKSDPARLQKVHQLFDGWQRFHESWLKRWAEKWDPQRFSPEAVRADEDRPTEADAARLLRRTLQAVELINLAVRMRQHLGLQVDDWQSLEEILQERPLPSL
jgi:hypothetical protein